MSSPNLHLANLLSPIPPAAFFADTWEKEPLFLNRAEGETYAGLFSLEDLDNLIAFTRPQFTERAAFQDAPQSRPTYVRGTLDPQPVMPSDNPGIAELRQVFEQGRSVVIMGMQRRWPAIARLCRNLEQDFRCPVHANLYLTPAKSQGFAPHFDPHEVFVLQLQGGKTWRVYEAPQELPLATDSQPTAKRPSGQRWEAYLQPGDLLYIPRGRVHEAFTGETFSLHLTVGVNVYRWADLLRHVLMSAGRRNIRFRESLPGGALAPDKSQGKPRIRELLEELAVIVSDDEVLQEAWEALGDQFFGQMHMLPGNQFKADSAHQTLDLETVLENTAFPLCRVVNDEQGAAIEFPGNRVAGPHRVALAMRFVAGVKRFTVGALPDNLSPGGKVVLVKRLLREGLLTVVAQPRPLRAPESAAPGTSDAEETVCHSTWVNSETSLELNEANVES